MDLKELTRVIKEVENEEKSVIGKWSSIQELLDAGKAACDKFAEAVRPLKSQNFEKYLELRSDFLRRVQACNDEQEALLAALASKHKKHLLLSLQEAFSNSEPVLTSVLAASFARN
jgi:hypothetical protein